MECEVNLVGAGRRADAAAFNLMRPVIMLPDTGKFRCQPRLSTVAPFRSLLQSRRRPYAPDASQTALQPTHQICSSCHK